MKLTGSVVNNSHRGLSPILLASSVTRLDDLLPFGLLFKACVDNYFGQIAHVLGRFCKGVKIFHFSSEIIFLGNFYRHLAIFYCLASCSLLTQVGTLRRSHDLVFRGQSYKHFKLVNYDYRVVTDYKIALYYDSRLKNYDRNLASDVFSNLPSLIIQLTFYLPRYNNNHSYTLFNCHTSFLQT